MTADNVLAVLSVAFRATDTASIESCAISVGFLDDHETQRLVGDVHGEEMEFSIIHLLERDANFLAVDGNRRRGRRGRICTRGYISSSEQQEYHQARRYGRHPTIA